ncbi:MAG: energy transducer TonB [Myxococcota bacterium]
MQAPEHTLEHAKSLRNPGHGLTARGHSATVQTSVIRAVTAIALSIGAHGGLLTLPSVATTRLPTASQQHSLVRFEVVPMPPAPTQAEEVSSTTSETRILKARRRTLHTSSTSSQAQPAGTFARSEATERAVKARAPRAMEQPSPQTAHSASGQNGETSTSAAVERSQTKTSSSPNSLAAVPSASEGILNPGNGAGDELQRSESIDRADGTTGPRGDEVGSGGSGSTVGSLGARTGQGGAHQGRGDGRYAARQWMTAVNRAIGTRAGRSYPRSARRAGLQGTVIVAIDVVPSGAIRGVTVLRSSTHPILDEAAVAAVRAVGSLPPPPAIFNRRGRPLTMPIAYRID